MRRAPDDELRRIYRSLLERTPAGPCPEGDLLIDILLQPRSEQTESAREHILVCAQCASDFRDLNAIHRQNLKRRILPGWLVLAAASFFVFAVLGILVRSLDRADQAPVMRSETALLDTVPGNLAHLSRMPEVFDWPDVAGASQYVLSLADLDGAVIWTSDPVAESRLRLAVEPPARHRYAWFVDVHGAANQDRLGPFVFTLD